MQILQCPLVQHFHAEWKRNDSFPLNELFNENLLSEKEFLEHGVLLTETTTLGGFLPAELAKIQRNDPQAALAHWDLAVNAARQEANDWRYTTYVIEKSKHLLRMQRKEEALETLNALEEERREPSPPEGH